MQNHPNDTMFALKNALISRGFQTVRRDPKHPFKVGVYYREVSEKELSVIDIAHSYGVECTYDEEKRLWWLELIVL